jgi:hypothetical protein
LPQRFHLGTHSIGTFDTQEQAAHAIAAEVGYAAGGRLHLRVQPVEDSSYRGVTMRSKAFRGKMWLSHIHVNGTQLALGSFDTKEEAAAAFDVATRT